MPTGLTARRGRRVSSAVINRTRTGRWAGRSRVLPAKIVPAGALLLRRLRAAATQCPGRQAIPRSRPARSWPVPGPGTTVPASRVRKDSTGCALLGDAPPRRRPVPSLEQPLPRRLALAITWAGTATGRGDDTVMTTDPITKPAGERQATVAATGHAGPSAGAGALPRAHRLRVRFRGAPCQGTSGLPCGRTSDVLADGQVMSVRADS